LIKVMKNININPKIDNWDGAGDKCRPGVRKML
jgi:hypothetical protein